MLERIPFVTKTSRIIAKGSLTLSHENQNTPSYPLRSCFFGPRSARQNCLRILRPTIGHACHFRYHSSQSSVAFYLLGRQYLRRYRRHGVTESEVPIVGGTYRISAPQRQYDRLGDVGRSRFWSKRCRKKLPEKRRIQGDFPRFLSRTGIV